MGDLADLDALGTAAVYVVVIGFVFVECALLIGFFLPGDTLLFAGGLVAADVARGVDLGWLLAGYLAASVPWVEHVSLAVAVTAVVVTTVVGLVRWRRAQVQAR